METPAAPTDSAGAAPVAPAPAGNAAAGSAPAGRAWRFVVEPRWLGWHAFAVVAFWGMLWLGDWQLHRALSGNDLSWAYTFEWPLFAVAGAFFWARTMRDEYRIRSGKIPDPKIAEAAADAILAARAAGASAPVTDQAGGPEGGPEDEKLATYNAYLARLNSEVKRHGKWHGLG